MKFFRIPCLAHIIICGLVPSCINDAPEVKKDVLDIRIDTDGDTDRDSETNPSPETAGDTDTTKHEDTSVSDSSSDTLPVSEEDTQSQHEPACDERTFQIGYLPSRLMILLDRSASMGISPPTPSKWQQAKNAMTTLLKGWKGNGLPLEFGFDVFPNVRGGGYNCSTWDPLLVDAAPESEKLIIAYLNDENMEAGGMTPLCQAMRRFVKTEYPDYAPLFTSPDKPSYLLVVAAGQDSCGGWRCSTEEEGTPSLGQMAELTRALLAEGIKTFVIGFGNDVLPDELNAVAASGGTNFDTYLAAHNQSQLQQAFERIARSAVICTYSVDDPSASADPDKVNFYFDETAVPWDPHCAKATGWTWTDDTRTVVEFCKKSCNQLAGGEVGVVSARLGCPVVIVN